MKRLVQLAGLLLALFATPALASHPWAGVDICASRPDALPAGVDPARLPGAGSPGAVLLTRYCAQCHNLPDPGRHSGEEWPEVLARMEALTRVSGFYRGPLGPAAMPDAGEWTLLGDYLRRHAPSTPSRPAAGDDPSGRMASLFAFFGLAGLGIWRWRRGRWRGGRR